MDKIRLAFIIAIGLSAASLSGWLTTHIYLKTYQSWVKMQTALYEERLIHEMTKRDSLERRVAEFERKEEELWRWNKEMMEHVNRLSSSDKNLFDYIESLEGQLLTLKERR